jgi:hypothetical protein
VTGYRLPSELVPTGVLAAAAALARRIEYHTDWDAVQITIRRQPSSEPITFDVQAGEES